MKKIERIKDRIIITLVFLVTIILAVLLLMSCESESKGQPAGNVDGFEIIVIDNCEYLKQHTYYYDIYIHKGNCRYCTERNRRIIREQVDSILTEIYD